MTTIPINDNVRLRWDSTCLVAESRTVIKSGKKEGADKWTIIGFYSSIQQAAELLLRNHADLFLPVDVASLGDLRALMDEHSKRIAAAVAAGPVVTADSAGEAA